MIITRKKKIPLHWAFYAQLPLILSIYGNMFINAPFLLLMKKFIDNPAAIIGLISIEVYLTVLGQPFISWLSDRIWTRFGRRKIFIVLADGIRGILILSMPFAPNLWTLIILRWIYGAVSDLGATTQALIYEILPPQQRGISSGFKSAFMQLGNVVFFFLVLGRFDDVYFMGPFSHLMTLQGGTIMFALASVLLLGIFAFEALGIKEIYPVGRQRLRDGIDKSRNIVIQFVRSFLKDVLAKDLAPLYLILFASLFFQFKLGLFRPLLFTEQWGYSLQDMGNVVAIGVVIGVVCSLIGGWMADRYGKMLLFFLSHLGSLLVNIAYTIFVWYKPDNRPDFWEIVFFGNLDAIFDAIRSGAAFPLLMEFVRRNRMGSASAGYSLFNSIFRGTVGLAVGGWLFIWSVWFFPASGYHVELFLSEDKSVEQIESILESADMDPEAYIIRPMHQYGVDGPTSSRWWIHQNVETTGELLEERKDLENEIATLDTKSESILISEQEREEIKKQIEQKRQRQQEITRLLESEGEPVVDRILSAFEGMRFAPGDQILSASLDDNRLQLTVRTLEPLGRHQGTDHSLIVERSLQGPEHQLVPTNGPDAKFKYKANIHVESFGANSHAVRVEMELDRNFLRLFEAAIQSSMPAGEAYQTAGRLLAALRGLAGRQPDSFTLSQASFTKRSGGENDPSDRPSYQVSLAIQGSPSPSLEPQRVLEALQTLDGISEADARRVDQAVAIEATLLPVADSLKSILPGDSEEALRLRQLGIENPVDLALFRLAYQKLHDALKASPVHVTIPRHEEQVSYAGREYEYFFSSQALIIGTDILGILILVLILKLEKRGVLHRYGVEEDARR